MTPYGQPVAAGQGPSRNTITKAHAGCVVLEHYQAGSFSGESVNIYDRSRGQWHQTWVDSTGGLHEYWGRRDGTTMVFHGSTPSRTDPAVRHQVRLTFFDLGDGRVRQRSERLNADGTWSVNYDLLYTRRSP